MENFDWQWEHLTSPDIEYNQDRVKEFLSYIKLRPSYFKNKKCLDAGCGNGRWTYAMQQLGADVTSFDISQSAVNKCHMVNPNAFVMNLLGDKWTGIDLGLGYDFVFCWGVLHHLSDPRLGFKNLARVVKHRGIMHIMVYNNKSQQVYEYGRKHWPNWTHKQRIDYCNAIIARRGGNLHGWWDALNPTYNFSYDPKEIKQWFIEEGFKHIKMTKRYNINMRGVK